MSQQAVESFLGRIITDGTFCTKAKTALEKTCLAEGLILSREEIASLKKIDLSRLHKIEVGLSDLLKRA